MIREFMRYMWHRKALWLLPLMLALGLVGLLLTAGEATVLAPFIYPLF